MEEMIFQNPLHIGNIDLLAGAAGKSNTATLRMCQFSIAARI